MGEMFLDALKAALSTPAGTRRGSTARLFVRGTSGNTTSIASSAALMPPCEWTKVDLSDPPDSAFVGAEVFTADRVVRLELDLSRIANVPAGWSER